ncbi:unnamed protein product [Rhodiola kirilowii]
MECRSTLTPTAVDHNHNRASHISEDSDCIASPVIPCVMMPLNRTG